MRRPEVSFPMSPPPLTRICVAVLAQLHEACGGSAKVSSLCAQIRLDCRIRDAERPANPPSPRNSEHSWRAGRAGAVWLLHGPAARRAERAVHARDVERHGYEVPPDGAPGSKAPAAPVRAATDFMGMALVFIPAPPPPAHSLPIFAAFECHRNPLRLFRPRWAERRSHAPEAQPSLARVSSSLSRRDPGPADGDSGAGRCAEAARAPSRRRRAVSVPCLAACAPDGRGGCRLCA